jgi:hypothetical protein
MSKITVICIRFDGAGGKDRSHNDEVIAESAFAKVKFFDVTTKSCEQFIALMTNFVSTVAGSKMIVYIGHGDVAGQLQCGNGYVGERDLWEKFTKGGGPLYMGLVACYADAWTSMKSYYGDYGGFEAICCHTSFRNPAPVNMSEDKQTFKLIAEKLSNFEFVEFKEP